MATDIPVIKKKSRNVRILYLLVSFVLLSLSAASAAIGLHGVSQALFEGWQIERIHAKVLVYRSLVWGLSVLVVDSVLVSTDSKNNGAPNLRDLSGLSMLRGLV